MSPEKACPWCQSTSYCKNGFIRGQQRYRCKDCRRTFSVFKKGKSIEDLYLIDALHLYLEGMSSYQIQNVLGPGHVTILKWLKRYARQLPRSRKGISGRVVSGQELIGYLQGNGLLHHLWCITPNGLCILVGRSGSEVHLSQMNQDNKKYFSTTKPTKCK